MELANNDLARDLCGAQDSNIKFIEEKLGIHIHVRGLNLTISGQPSNVHVGYEVIKQLCELLKRGYILTPSDIERSVIMLSKDSSTRIDEVFSDNILMSTTGKPIAPRSPAQKHYIDAIRRFPLVFAVGPAGTGKTYLAVAMAVAMFMKKKYKRIVLARPAVEAGEKLGFLPGDIQAKVSPYLRPLYDALYDMMETEKVNAFKENDIIEIAPLAFMRGRTLNNAFVILDEAQNCTQEQMKMCLTRLGVDSQMVVTGDVTQIDLPFQKNSGLVHAIRILKGISEINFTYFTQSDVVRHELVKKIIMFYDKKKK
ncbi:PhoH family protein [bacterium]|nr:PhoH family protein [bacterium]